MITLEVIQPNNVKINQEVDHVIIPGSEGYFGVYEGHTPFLTKIKPGVLSVYHDKSENKVDYAIHDGFVMVEQSYVKIICEIVEKADEVDVNRAKEAQQRAEKRLKNNEKGINFRRAEMALKRAMARLDSQN